MVYIGCLTIKNVSGSANIQFGHTADTSTSSSKSMSGSGSENTGALVVTNSMPSQTTTPSSANNGNSIRSGSFRIEFNVS